MHLVWMHQGSYDKMKLLRIIREALIVIVWSTVVIVFLLYLIWVTGMVANCAK